MRALFGIGIALLAASSGAFADTPSLAGSYWRCTRGSDQSQFIIVFYRTGGVGGGELQAGEVSPYIYDATNRPEGEWPGHWAQKGQSFSWSFPDQHMAISGTIVSPGQTKMRLRGTETAAGAKTAITCTRPTKPLKIGEGLVIPKDGHFIDLNGEEQKLKVPAGISLQAGEP